MDSFDERSAAFFALGGAFRTWPAAVVTTSGTAAAELLPAVVEAYYQRRPLLLLTADRPADYRGSAAPQAIEQADMFAFMLPVVDLQTPDDLPEDILEDWDYASPLHINVCLPDPDPTWNPGHCDLYPAEPPEENKFLGSLSGLAQALRFKSPPRPRPDARRAGLTEQAPALWLANELAPSAGCYLRSGGTGPSGPDGCGPAAETESARRSAESRGRSRVPLLAGPGGYSLYGGVFHYPHRLFRTGATFLRGDGGSGRRPARLGECGFHRRRQRPARHEQAPQGPIE